MPNASVDLSLVRGTEHGDYFDSTWRELLGDPAKNISPRLKRIRWALSELRENPEYYLSATPKENWSCYLLAGNYYVSTGNHRTVVGRFFLELNGLPTTVHGVDVVELVPRSLETPTGTQNTAKSDSILGALVR